MEPAEVSFHSPAEESPELTGSRFQMADLKMCWLPASPAAVAFEEGLSGGRASMRDWFEVSCEPEG